MKSNSDDDAAADYDAFMATIIERVQRATRGFQVLDEAESIVFEEMIRIELNKEN